jgi:hypothetical protein
MTPEGLDYEGNAMGHCVGRGAYDEGCEILSLRDRNNLPHCTVEWNEDDKTVQQVQGRANQSVVSTYHGMVVALVEHLEARQVYNAGKFEHVFASFNGTRPRLIHWSKLKPNDKIDGSLSLAGCTALTHLPEGLRVGGSLSLAGCTALTHLPEGLRVDGDLYLRGCTALTHLPEGLRVGGKLDLFRCTALTHLPEGLRVRGSLYLGGCTALTHLPEGLRVGGAILGSNLKQASQTNSAIKGL